MLSLMAALRVGTGSWTISIGLREGFDETEEASWGGEGGEKCGEKKGGKEGGRVKDF